MFLEPNSISLLFCKTNNLLVITKPKIATKYLTTYFDVQVKEIPIYNLGNVILNDEEIDDVYLNEIHQAWDDFLNKKWKGKVIVLFRNPYQRFITGFVQDYLNSLRNYKSFAASGTISYGFFNNWFFEKGMSPTSIDEFIVWSLYSDRTASTEKEKKFLDIYSEYVLLHLKCLIETSVYTGHNQQYLSTILNLLVLDILDTKEHIFHDLDAGGISLLQLLHKNGIKQISNNNSLQTNSNSGHKNIIDQIIKENNLSTMIGQCLSLEQNAYDVLKAKLKIKE